MVSTTESGIAYFSSAERDCEEISLSKLSPLTLLALLAPDALYTRTVSAPDALCTRTVPAPDALCTRTLRISLAEFAGEALDAVTT